MTGGLFVIRLWIERWSCAIGGAIWAVGTLLVLPQPFDLAWGKALLLLAAFVLVPLGLGLTACDSMSGWANRLHRLAMGLQLPAALLLGWAYFLPQGLLACGLALPWLMTTAVIAAAGLLRIHDRGLKPSPDLCIDAGLVYIAVGGAWAAADRLGYRPLGFDPVIVLLTAIHFHYAGFILPIVTGLAMRSLPGIVASLAGLLTVAGIPLVAVGITATHLGASPIVECLAATALASGGLLTACLHLRLAIQPAWPRAARIAWAVAGSSLLGSMVLAVLYGMRFFVPVAWLDIPWMRALHGTANALGFGLGGLLGWWLAPRRVD